MVSETELGWCHTNSITGTLDKFGSSRPEWSKIPKASHQSGQLIRLMHFLVMHHQMHLWFTEWRTRFHNSYLCDASPNAYGFVGLRSEERDVAIHIFVMHHQMHTEFVVYGVKNEMSQFIFMWCITKCIRICGLRSEERNVTIHIFVMHHQMHTDLWFTGGEERNVTIHIYVMQSPKCIRICGLRSEERDFNNSYFCDASPNAYGFVVYGVKNEVSQFIFLWWHHQMHTDLWFTEWRTRCRNSIFLWCITKCIRICGLRSEERDVAIHIFVMHHQMHTDLWFTEWRTKCHNSYLQKPRWHQWNQKHYPLWNYFRHIWQYKTLRTLLKSYAQMKLKHICIAVDSQVVVSWLLSENIKAKRQYTRNSVKRCPQNDKWNQTRLFSRNTL